MFKRLSGPKRRGLVSDPAEVARAFTEEPCLPAFNEWLDECPEYDIVILGGGVYDSNHQPHVGQLSLTSRNPGTAGCVLASRLSEDPDCRVLLLEAGESGSSRLYSRIPLASSKLFQGDASWAVKTEPQDFAEERQLYWPRAKMLGGCSSINGLMFHNGSPSDFDEWALIAGDPEWRWEHFQFYFKKFENFTQHKGYFAKQMARGRGGPMQTGFVGFHSNFAKLFIKSCVKHGVQRRHDFNTSESTLGTGRLMTFIDSGGKRSSTESAYLTSDVLARPNLVVLTGAHITRVLLAKSLMGGEKRAEGVEFAAGENRQRYRVRARREVVLSCGAVHTPQVLMLSGIGPAEHLRDIGIPCLHDLPVGQNLMDHVSGIKVNLRYRVTSNESLNSITHSGWKQIYALPSFAQWALFGTGKFLCTIADSVAFVRSTDRRLFPEHLFPDEVGDATTGENAPDIELFASPIAWWNHGLPTEQELPDSTHNLCSISSVLLRPTSLGDVTLRSADPFDQPIINPNYLSTQHDVAVLRRSVRLLLTLSQSQPLASVISRTETSPALDQSLHELSDPELDAVIRRRVETLYHPTSTARMASLSDGGVCDGHLRVHGIENLRIVDASAFPMTTSGHTAAPVIALAGQPDTHTHTRHSRAVVHRASS
ncbi:alcohol oxidase [Auriculariales sp. MPI-PUGE-AT-0066]|nr:alcohol oxidase [Auriculariales sp. MPI-PUGE-AT-0066]